DPAAEELGGYRTQPVQKLLPVSRRELTVFLPLVPERPCCLLLHCGCRLRKSRDAAANREELAAGVAVELALHDFDAILHGWRNGEHAAACRAREQFEGTLLH